MTKHLPYVLGGKYSRTVIATVVMRFLLALCLAAVVQHAATASPIARATATTLPAVTAPICSLCTATGNCKCSQTPETTFSSDCSAGFLGYFMSQQASTAKCLECASTVPASPMNWRSGYNEVDMLIIRLTACINRQDLGRVVKTAEELGRRGAGSPNYYYAAARGYAMIVTPPPSKALDPNEKSVVVKSPAATSGAAEQIVAPEPETAEKGDAASAVVMQRKQRQQASFAQRSIHFLQQAERNGYFDSPARVEQLHDDAAFKSMRAEPQFVRFLQLISPKTGMPPMPGDELPASPPEMIPAE